MLYTRLAGYWMSCIKEYLSMYGGQFIIVRDRVSHNAPFQFHGSDNLYLYDHDNFSKKSLLDFCISENPDIVYVAGWTHNDYLSVARYFFKKDIPVICGLDNPWENTLRQRYGTVYSNYFLKKCFTHIWIPGDPQYKFARRLGFSSDQILMGLYSADYNLFYNEYLKNGISKSRKFPHRFIYVGRYFDFKGIRDLWKAFLEFQNETDSDWELWSIGTGDLFDKRLKHPKVRHIGFVQPSELPKYLSDTGVFILPSHREHWGVVVHEFAAAGFPLICSDNVMAATKFLEDGRNGFIHKAKDASSLKDAMIRISNMEDVQLVNMGELSVAKAGDLTPESWAMTLRKLYVKA